MDGGEAQRRHRVEARHPGRRQEIPEEVREERDGHPHLGAVGDHRLDGSEQGAGAGDDDLVDHLILHQLGKVHQLVDHFGGKPRVHRGIRVVDEADDVEAPVGMALDRVEDARRSGTAAHDQEIARVAPPAA